MSNVNFIMQRDEQCMFSQKQRFRFCIGFSIFFALAALTTLIGYVHYSQNWVRVTGTVKSAEFKQERIRSQGSMRTVRSVTFTYVGRSKEGDAIEGRKSISDVGNLKMATGQKIELLYAQDDPQSHMSVHELNVILKFCLMFGFMAIFSGVLAQRYRASE